MAAVSHDHRGMAQCSSAQMRLCRAFDPTQVSSVEQEMQHPPGDALHVPVHLVIDVTIIVVVLLLQPILSGVSLFGASVLLFVVGHLQIKNIVRTGSSRCTWP